MSKHNAHHHGHNETLNFYSCSSISSCMSGYGGFDYAGNFEALDAIYWQNIETQWCDNGYINVTDASKGATGCAYIYDYGQMESANPKETFTLKSMIAASAWDTNAVWDIKSYTYVNGSLSLKASDSVTLSQTAHTVNFAKLGKSGDFKNISMVFFGLQSEGSGGNTCSYGSPTYGYQMVLDYVKVHWNGKIPGAHGELRSAHAVVSHVHHVTAASLFMPTEKTDTTSNHNGSNDHSSGSAHHDSGGYHSMLTSLDTALGHNSGHGLTSQFVLPQTEHFGT